MTAVEFEHKATADHFREEHPDAICPDDDARLKTVQFRGDGPNRVIEEAERAAFDEVAEEGEKSGQVPLDDGERDRLDFSKDGVNVPKAQAVKGIALDKGVTTGCRTSTPLSKSTNTARSSTNELPDRRKATR
ncbi:MAG: hypothetical protein U5K70_04425 [Halodesulfurarchaeum sp.]|nr:hypothetical protein [Halodesulfurarchaeum sp.]